MCWKQKQRKENNHKQDCARKIIDEQQHPIIHAETAGPLSYLFCLQDTQRREHTDIT